MKKIGWKQGNDGQTIIEVLIAAAVISIALTAMVSVVTSAMARNREAKERIVAARVAQEIVENFRIYRDKNGWDNFMQWNIVNKTGTNDVTYVGCVDSANNITVGSGISYTDLQLAVVPSATCGNLTINNTVYRRGVLITYNETASPEKFSYTTLVDWSKTGGKPAHLEVSGVLYEY